MGEVIVEIKKIFDWILSFKLWYVDYLGRKLFFLCGI